MINHLGVVGLGTMGANVARNAARNGATVAVYNRHTEKVDSFMSEHGSEGSFIPCKEIKELCAALPAPRAILLMVKAGEAVDDILQALLPFLDPGDILIDGGNSHYRDTERRVNTCLAKSVSYIGMGISGGEQGALHGPSMMPGGNKNAVLELLPLLSKMSAGDGEGGTCVAYMGSGGAGHFVKMVHNGIEYGVMQLIAESYAIMKSMKLDTATIAKQFAEWNSGDLQSYLVEITANVLAKIDVETGKHLVELIKDQAGQKGTGRWTVEAALQYGTPIPSVSAAVEARGLSANRDERVRRASMYPEAFYDVPTPSLDDIRRSLTAATVVTYVQGFDLLSAATTTEKWALPFAEIARIWRGGCIIRSSLLAVFEQAWKMNAKNSKGEILKRLEGKQQESWRHAASYSLGKGIPIPALSASLAYYDSMRSSQLPQNLIQAQRDYFGAHTYERIDREGVFHTDW